MGKSAKSRKRPSIGPLDDDNSATICTKKTHKCLPSSEYGEVQGIPKHQLTKFKELRKIKEFYPWQLEFLNDQRLIDRQNAFLTAGTGGGKSFVAELLILRAMITRNCSAILALPYVALAVEKVPIFKALSKIFNIDVKECAGDVREFPEIPVPKPNRTLYICSYELADIVYERLNSADQINDIGLLVLDEIHMVGERMRGGNLEMFTVKYRPLPCGQIVAMSATVGNIEQLAKFIGGFRYHSDFRPVPLRQYVVSKGTVLRVQDDKLISERRINWGTWFVHLAFEIVPQHSVLMFCNTPDYCERTCSFLCNYVPKALEMHKTEERQQFIDNLVFESKKEDFPLPENLEKSLIAGIAYHHSKISKSQRRAIEQGFRDGIISIICSTTTLAAGVNLPVRRVIIKTPIIGADYMDKTNYLQMAGRAGRAGLDDVGECFICADENYSRVADLVLRDPVPECESRLKLEPFIYKLISFGQNTEDKLKESMNKTLYYLQNPDAVEKLEQTIVDLKEPQFIIQNSQDELALSPLAKAAHCLRIKPQSLLNLIEYFKTCNNSLFSIIDYYIPKKKFMAVNVDNFCNEYLKLDDADKELMGGGVSHEEMSYYLVSGGDEPPPKLKKCYRFYAALMVYRLFQSKMEDSECSKLFHITNGILHEVCKSVLSKMKALKRAAHFCDEMIPLRKPAADLILFLKKYSKKL